MMLREKVVNYFTECPLCSQSKLHSTGTKNDVCVNWFRTVKMPILGQFEICEECFLIFTKDFLASLEKL